jgi:hypothetical protein
MYLYSRNFPYAYYKGKVFYFGTAKETRPTYFGGPGPHLTTGIEYGPYPLHHIMTIWNRDVGIASYVPGTSVPFFYGLCYDGCRLEYKRKAIHAIELTKLVPTASSDYWPYPNYPAHLPYIPMEVKETRDFSLEEFSGSIMQGIKGVAENEMILVVPPNPECGMSIWGYDGDAEDVQIIFRYNTELGTTCAYNACT